MTQVAVLICGAGPVGLVAGLRLARAGIETLVIDKASFVSEDFRASTFHPPTLEMLDELDLTKDLIAHGLVSPTWQIRRHESTYLDSLLVRSARYQRDLLCRLLPDKLIANAPLLEGLVLLQSIDTWVSLRREQGLNAADAMAVIRQATRALIAGLD